MATVTRVRALPGYELEVEFSDGLAGKVSLESRLFGPMFAPLRDEALFKLVTLDPFGAPCWPNGADLAPDGLYLAVKESLRASAGA